MNSRPLQDATIAPSIDSGMELHLNVTAAAAARIMEYPPQRLGVHELATLSIRVDFDRARLDAEMHLGNRDSVVRSFEMLDIHRSREERMHHLDVCNGTEESLVSCSFDDEGRVLFVRTSVPQLIGLPAGTYEAPTVRSARSAVDAGAA